MKCWKTPKSFQLTKSEIERNEMEKIETGNQQVTDLEMGWLAGILDGEGHITMKTAKYQKWIHYSIEIGFTNTSLELLEKLASICLRLGVNLHWMKKKMPKSCQPCWILTTKKMSHCYRILDKVLPLLTVKRERADLLFAFCKRRLEFAFQSKNTREISIKFPYNEEDLFFFRKFRETCYKPVTPTTISQESRIQRIRRMEPVCVPG